MELNVNLIHFRLKKLGWTYTALARELGVSRQCVSEIMRGSRKPGWRALERWAKALDVKPTRLLVD